MSKSKDNYIGIMEPPKIMFRKIMRISDELMFRYYQLLTDMQESDIASLRQAIATGEQDAMMAKMDLGRRIVADFHSPVDAEEAFEVFDREVRQGLEPVDTETVDLPGEARTAKGIRMDKLVAKVGLAQRQRSGAQAKRRSRRSEWRASHGTCFEREAWCSGDSGWEEVEARANWLGVKAIC